MAKVTANYEVVYIIDPAQGEEGIAALVAKFKKSIRHPGGSDLIYYPQLIDGFPKDREPTVDEIVDMAMKEI